MMHLIEKYAQAAASTARTPPNSPARRAALDAENAARVAAERERDGLMAEVTELRKDKAQLIDEVEAAKPPAGWSNWWHVGRVADLEAERDAAQQARREAREQVRKLTAERDELRARLAELERQEPVATAWMNGAATVNAFNHPPRSNFDPDGYWANAGFYELPLYARPVSAIPTGWKLVPVKPTREQWTAGGTATA